MHRMDSRKIAQLMIVLFLWQANYFVDSVLLHRMSLEDYPQALCNDGTTAVYYKGDSNLESKKVSIYLAGGGACLTPAACAQRCMVNDSPLCTAKTELNMTKSERMWSDDPVENPPFHDYQKIYLPYCSSDIYSGNNTYSDGILSMIFHGRLIVEAMIKDLMPILKTAESVVLSGGSAGAFGTSLNCDFVADLIHTQNPSAAVRCIADAGDFYPYWVHQEGCTVDQIAQQTTKFWGAQGDDSCLKENDEIYCGIFGRYYRYIETPLMAVTSYTDTNNEVHPCAPHYPENPDFWDEWRMEMQEFAVNFTQEMPDNGLFLVNCPLHVLSSKGYAWDELPIQVEGEDLVLKDAVNNWMKGNGKPFQAIDTYNAFNKACPTVDGSESASSRSLPAAPAVVLAASLATAVIAAVK